MGAGPDQSCIQTHSFAPLMLPECCWCTVVHLACLVLQFTEITAYNIQELLTSSRSQPPDCDLLGRVCNYRIRIMISERVLVINWTRFPICVLCNELASFMTMNKAPASLERIDSPWWVQLQQEFWTLRKTSDFFFLKILTVFYCIVDLCLGSLVCLRREYSSRDIYELWQCRLANISS